MRFRIVYSTQAELAAEVAQMAHGGVLVRDPAAARLAFDTPVVLELVMPDGATLVSGGKVLQALAGLGVAVTIEKHVVENVRAIVDGTAPRAPLPRATTSPPISLSRAATSSTPPGGLALPRAATTSRPPTAPFTSSEPALPRAATTSRPPTAPFTSSEPALPRAATTSHAPATSEPMLPRAATSSTPPGGLALPGAATTSQSPVSTESTEKAEATELTRAQKIHLALHGTREQRNAMLRDRDRGIHPFVLKNPGINLDDILAIVKNAQTGAEMFKQIAERPDWFQRPQVALALARNPKVPSEIAIRALAHVAPDALRQLAKGSGAPVHVVQAARKRVIDR